MANDHAVLPPLPQRHQFSIKSARFDVDVRYSPLKLLGKGAYGVVCSATDTTSNRTVAIKKIENAFQDLVDAKRILREIKMLRHFHHENVVALYDLIDPPLEQKFDDVYIVLEHMDTDMHKMIYSANDLTDDHIQYFLWQSLRGLKCIHSANVMHRDLKPSNLLLNRNCDLKICDFGLARGVDLAEEYALTEYVVTRWYRAPEVMLSVQEYNFKIDVWSLGCILGELLGRKALFPGDDYIKQITLIFSVLGTPTASDMRFITNPKALAFIQKQVPRAPTPLAECYPKANPLALDLLAKMIAFDPAHRISVDEALAHPYLKKLPKVHPTCPDAFDFQWEQQKMSKAKLRDLMWDEILHYRPQLTPYVRLPLPTAPQPVRA